MIWLASGQHAAFGQYPFGGYVPNRPTLMRKLIHQEDDPKRKSFLSKRFYHLYQPQLKATNKVMAVQDTLLTHSPDEYLSQVHSLQIFNTMDQSAFADLWAFIDSLCFLLSNSPFCNITSFN